MYDKMRGEGYKPDVITYSTLLAACARADDLQRALAVGQDFDQLGIRPNQVISHPSVYLYDFFENCCFVLIAWNAPPLICRKPALQITGKLLQTFSLLSGRRWLSQFNDSLGFTGCPTLSYFSIWKGRQMARCNYYLPQHEFRRGGCSRPLALCSNSQAASTVLTDNICHQDKASVTFVQTNLSFMYIALVNHIVLTLFCRNRLQLYHIAFCLKHASGKVV
jgi:pentatricopeptide repeat protein